MTREFSRNIKSKGIIISETTSWGWHGIKQPSGKHNTINILLTRAPRVLGEYSVEVAVQTVNLLLSGSGGSTPSSPIISSEYEIWGCCPRCKKQSACGLPVQIRWKSTQGRAEKWNLTRLIFLRTAVRIRLLQLNPLRVKLFVYRRSMPLVDLRMSVNVQLTRRLRKKLFREMRPLAVRSDSRQF